jgi:hypothetical protein
MRRVSSRKFAAQKKREFTREGQRENSELAAMRFSGNFTANSISKKHGICDVGNIVERKIKVNDSFCKAVGVSREKKSLTLRQSRV